MKKITLIILFTLGLFSVASADLGINLGVSSHVGVFEAKAVETEDTTVSGREEAMGVFGYTSYFIEKDLGFLPGPFKRFTIAYSMVPDALNSETKDETRNDLRGDASDNVVTQTVQVDFDNFETTYVSFNITENFYVRAANSTVDIITNETLETGSVYGNANIKGSSYGAGYDKSFDNGFFYRIEGNIMQFDPLTLTSSSRENTDGEFNKVTVDEFNGVEAKFSIGKSF